MNALTIHQPWAWAIVDGANVDYAPKRIENRTWKAPQGAIGQRIAIHAGKTVDTEAIEHLEGLGFNVPPLDAEIGALPLGAVVGVATLKVCSTWVPPEDHPQHFWWRGPVAWVLEHVVELRDPIPQRGYQKLWRLPKLTADLVEETLAEIRIEKSWDQLQTDRAARRSAGG